jgi:hypothetical protein
MHDRRSTKETKSFSKSLWQRLIHYRNTMLDIVHCLRYICYTWHFGSWALLSSTPETLWKSNTPQAMDNDQHSDPIKKTICSSRTAYIALGQPHSLHNSVLFIYMLLFYMLPYISWIVFLVLIYFLTAGIFTTWKSQ